MLGKRSDQKGLWEADRLYLDYVGKDTFYGLLASLRGQLFSDDDFAEIYCPDNGRDSVPPSLLATALLLQTYDKVSDAEAKARADFDIRWKVALGIEIEDRPFAKSTLQMFRAQLILHDKVREVFESSLRLARQSGYLKKRGMRVALDTTNRRRRVAPSPSITTTDCQIWCLILRIRPRASHRGTLMAVRFRSKLVAKITLSDKLSL